MSELPRIPEDVLDAIAKNAFESLGHHQFISEITAKMISRRAIDGYRQSLADAGYHLLREGEVPPWFSDTGIQAYTQNHGTDEHPEVLQFIVEKLTPDRFREIAYPLYKNTVEES